MSHTRMRLRECSPIDFRARVLLNVSHMMSHIWMSHVTPMNVSQRMLLACLPCAKDTRAGTCYVTHMLSHIYMGHVTHMNKMSHVTHVNETCHVIHGVATIRKLLKIMFLFCRIQSLS